MTPNKLFNRYWYITPLAVFYCFKSFKNDFRNVNCSLMPLVPFFLKKNG